MDASSPLFPSSIASQTASIPIPSPKTPQKLGHFDQSVVSSLSFTPSKSLHPFTPQSSASPGSVVRREPGTRTLRRKRSSANASLTSRPTLSLRERSKSFLATSPNDSQADSVAEIAERLTFSRFANLSLGQQVSAECSTASVLEPQPSMWQPSLSDIILIHTYTTFEKDEDNAVRSKVHLGHALLQPDLVVDGQGSVFPLNDRTQWERARATVEEARIVGMNGASQQCPLSNRTFHVDGEENTQVSPVTSFYLHANAQQSHGVSSPHLMALSLVGSNAVNYITGGRPFVSKEADQHWLTVLPDQVRALVRQARDVICATSEANQQLYDNMSKQSSHQAMVLYRHILGLVAEEED